MGDQGARRLRVIDGEKPAEPLAVPHSFEDAFRRHYPLVRHLVGQWGVHPSAVEDVTQEVFVTVHRRWDSFDGRTAFSNWVVGIARRVAKDHRRSRRRAWLRRQNVPAWRPEPETPQESAERSEAARRVEQFLAGLPVEQREVFVMADVLGMRGPEIAESLGVPLNTIYSRLRLARRKFEEFVGKGGDQGGR